jgi:thiol-disulfide isomerase/thioredoxin
MTRSSLAARVAGIVVVLGLVVGVSLRMARAEGPADLKGKTAPDFTLKTPDDKEITLSKLKGKVVVVDFWATWCPPCRASLPHIQKLSADADKSKEGLVVLAVNAQEGKDKVEAFMKEHKFDFTVPMDSTGKALGAYAVRGIPTTLVVGRDGTIKFVTVGFDESEGGKAVDQAVEAALKEK